MEPRRPVMFKIFIHFVQHVRILVVYGLNVVYVVLPSYCVALVSPQLPVVFVVVLPSVRESSLRFIELLRGVSLKFWALRLTVNEQSIQLIVS